MAFRKLSVDEVPEMFAGLSKEQATRKASKIISNPATPQSNKDLVAQYVAANPGRFGEVARGRRGTSYSNPKVLTPADVEKTFARMGPKRANTYFNKCMANQNTPQANKVLLQQYYEAHPERFDTSRQSYSTARGRSWFGNRTNRTGQVLTIDDLQKSLNGMQTPHRKKAYLQSVINNSQTNEVTRANAYQLLASYGNTLPSDAQMELWYKEHGKNADPEARKRSFWSRFWKSKDEYNSMTPGEQKIFSTAMRNKDQGQNAQYALKYITNPGSTSKERMDAIRVVQDNKGMFFDNPNYKGEVRNNGRR